MTAGISDRVALIAGQQSVPTALPRAAHCALAVRTPEIRAVTVSLCFSAGTHRASGSSMGCCGAILKCRKSVEAIRLSTRKVTTTGRDGRGSGVARD
eukprot:4745621-Pleurochrysis_carterae.AAC.1